MCSHWNVGTKNAARTQCRERSAWSHAAALGTRQQERAFLGALWLQWGLEGILSQVGRISSSPASREPFSVFYFLTFFVVAAAEARRKRGT